jgi:uncharacterized protein (DUF1501 family)
MSMLRRRELLKTLGMAAVANSLPSVAFAKADTHSRFVLVVLRGAADGLAIAAPYGDGHYASVRGELTLQPPGGDQGLLKLDGLFGLHPSLAATHESFRADEALIVHAVASPYRARSHFDGQDLLENGASQVAALRDGWLNRALAPIGGQTTHAIALAQNAPLVLRGDNAVTSWAPSRLPDADDSTLRRLEDLYADDDFFASRLEQALTSQDIASGMDGMQKQRTRGNEAQQFGDLMSAAARFLTAVDGPNIAVVELGGWDTHANQGTTQGPLANRLAALDRGFGNLRDGLGSAWENSVIAVVTEFGRTVRVNGTRGTDHGTATAAILAGGALHGGKVLADWPGLAAKDLFEGRDLRPTTDIRSVFKSVLLEHLGLAPGVVEDTVFPDSRSATPLRNLIRT